MGEVYRAHDTRLARDVAIKVLPAALAADARLRARLEREARAVSRLNDPRICTLHDVGSEAGVDYLVMEYCEGETLAARLDRGAMPLADLVRVGSDIADGLARAHRAGIVHRDLKPSNIMLTPSGVKLLDFGLARRADEGSHDTTPLDDGLAGTTRYMAPEVLAGGEADARSDIFALGCVLYEMAAGQPAFSGTTKASVVAAILEHDAPRLSDVRPATPHALERLIAKCMAKLPAERWESAHDVADALRWIGEDRGQAATSRTKPLRVAAVVAGALAVAAGAAWIALHRAAPRPPHVTRFTIALPDAAAGTGAPFLPILFGSPTVAISPDGTHVAFSATTDGPAAIYVRQLDRLETTRLAGTDGGNAPFFSPDGRWIGFFSFGRLCKVPVGGGSVQASEAQLRGNGRGAAWSTDGHIYYSLGPNSGIWRVTDVGAKPEPVTEPNAAAGENSYRWPFALPDGDHLLLTIRTDRLTSFDDAKIAVYSVRDKSMKIVLEGGTCPRYVSTGDLIFARRAALYAVSFDLKTLTVTGQPRKVLDGVMHTTWSGAAQYSVSSDGDLVYVAGGASAPKTELLAVDREGHERPIAMLDVNAHGPELSRDERRLAFVISAANDDIGMYDFSSGIVTRLSRDGGDEFQGAWTPDGTRFVYVANRPSRVVEARIDGGPPTELFRNERGDIGAGMSCTPDGRYVAFSAHAPDTGFDIWLMALDGSGVRRPLVRTPYDETMPTISPDGRWIAFTSNMAGPAEVYVSPIDGDGRWQISSGGGVVQRWSSDGKELFYVSGDAIWSVPVTATARDFTAGKPRRLFGGSSPPWIGFTTSKNGFIALRTAESAVRNREINVVIDWRSELSPHR